MAMEVVFLETRDLPHWRSSFTSNTHILQPRRTYNFHRKTTQIQRDVTSNHPLEESNGPCPLFCCRISHQVQRNHDSPGSILKPGSQDCENSSKDGSNPTQAKGRNESREAQA
jgi:hypothetical protein